MSGKAHHGSQPPPGPPWDLPFVEAPLAFVDLEMTGLDPSKDRVIEVCIERVVGSAVVERLETLVRPDGDLTWDPSVHGISPEAVLEAPTFAEVAPRIASILDAAVLVAHAATWDVRFLEAELARAGKPATLPCFLDSLVLSRRVFGFERHSLEALAEALGAPERRAHRAGDDVRTLRHVFGRLVTELSPTTPRDLWHTEVETRHARPAILEALERALASGLPVRLRYRPSGKRPQELVMVVTKLASDLDPPRAIGYLLPGRGRRELRADRILQVEPEISEGP
jgi:DNA polymerase III subunit epsilon